jgi:hypothetical protein
MKLFRSLALSLMVLSLITGCNNESTRKSTWENPLVVSLGNVHGEYALNKESGACDYSRKMAFDSIIRQFDQNTILDTLVNYMDDTTSSKSVFEGKPVMVGVLCYEALSLLIYYEPVDEKGDIAVSWQGFIKPGVTPDELKAAKEAWKQVLQSRTFKVL